MITSCILSGEIFNFSSSLICDYIHATSAEEVQPRRINTIIRCTITASSCVHLLFITQQNVTVGLRGRTIGLCGEAYRRLKVQLDFHCQCNTVNEMHFTLICVCVFRAALFGPFRSWLGEVLGVELEPTVDISCARYEYTGELCCIFIDLYPVHFLLFINLTPSVLFRCSFVS